MKRLVIFLIILSVAAGIAVSLCYALLPSDYILCYSVYNGDTLYSITSYNYGTYLKKSDSDGIIFSGRLKHQNGRYKSVIAANDRVYTMAEVNGQIIVDEYDADGAYIGESFSTEKEGITQSLLSRFVQHKAGEPSKQMVDVVLIEGNEVLVYPISKDKKSELLYRVDPEDDAGLVWAQRGSEGLFCSDSAGRFYLLSDSGGLYPVNIGEGRVGFEPMVSGSALYFVDLSSTSFVEFLVMPGDYGENNAVLPRHDFVIEAGSEIYDGTTFSELRDIEISSDPEGFSLICGEKKSGGEYGVIYVRDLYGLFSAKSAVLPEPGFELYKCVLVFLGTAAAVFAALMLISLAVRRVLSARKVIIKQIVFSIVMILVFCVLIHFCMVAKVSNFVFSQTSALLTNTLDYISLNISGDEFRDGGLTDEQRSRYRRFESRKTVSVDEKIDLIYDYVNTGFMISFVEVARLTDGVYKYEYYTDQNPGADASYFIGEDNLSLLTDMRPGENVITSSKEYNAEWLEAACPIVDSGGKQVGFIQIGSRMDSVTDEINSFSGTITLFAMLAVAGIFALFIAVMAGLLRPLRKLKEAVSEVAEGKIGTTLTINSNDELQDIAVSFTNMSRRLEKNFRNITTISKAYERYLPKGFFRMMGKKNVLDVDPGDHSRAELTYLFIGIDQPDGLSGEDSFSDFNGIYSVTSGVLSVTGGTIQSFSNKLITCIFIGGAAAAAEAALTIQEKLRSRADVNGRITVSIHNSGAVIGVIGSGEAMKTITVSPAIELQPSMAEIISRFGLTFIVTESVLSELKAAGMNINARRLGRVNELLGGKGQSCEVIYEVIDGCPDEEKRLKLASLRSYELALEAAGEKNFVLARAQLIRVLRVNRNDLVARSMLRNISGESEEYDSERNERDGRNGRNERNERGKIGLEISS